MTMLSVTSKHSASECVLQRILPRFRLRTLPTICFRYQVKGSIERKTHIFRERELIRPRLEKNHKQKLCFEKK